jgi:hypothetical protein
VEAYKVGEWISRNTEGYCSIFFGKDEGFSGSNGYLAEENGESEFLKYGPCMIVIPDTGCTTQENNVGLGCEGLAQSLDEMFSVVANAFL